MFKISFFKTARSHQTVEIVKNQLFQDHCIIHWIVETVINGFLQDHNILPNIETVKNFFFQDHHILPK